MSSPVYSELRNKRVLITGASGGLGAAMARAFADNGARVLVHYFRREEGARQTLTDIEAKGSEGLLYRADLRSESAIEALAAFAQAQWDGVDILINNAGVVLKACVMDVGAEYWDDSQAVNLRAPYLLSRLMATQMIEQGREGVILNNSSIHARNSVQYFSAYAASKAGLEAMSRVMALEWAPHDIRVNCIAPGVVPVERTEEVLQDSKDLWMPHIPLQHYGRPEDIAQLALYLCSEQAGWVTGQSFAADGGMLARMDMPRRPKPPRPPRPEPVEDA